jgi:endonuclease/exonuclease/phosphatase family metal-dependent hydrolase
MDLTDRIAVWQQNVNKSRICQHGLVSNATLVRKGIDVIAIQEPSIDANGYTLASKDWIPIYPTPHRKTDATTRAVTLIRESIKSDIWEQIDFPSPDVVVIQFKGTWGKLLIVNIYNDCHSDETLRLLTEFHNRNRAEAAQPNGGATHIMWVGDFNRHHPHWDDPRDGRLFTNEATEAAEKLIVTLADLGLELALPSGTPTHRHHVTKLWSRLDQVFITDHSINALITCETQPDHWGVNTDHLPILTVLDLKVEHAAEQEIPNFRNVDWEEFQRKLSIQLDKTTAPSTITSQSQLN